MSLLLIAPLVLVMAAVVVALFLPKLLNPGFAVSVLVTVMFIATFSTLAALVLVMFAGFSDISSFSNIFGWCRSFYGGAHGASPFVGVLAFLFLFFFFLQSSRYVQKVHRDLSKFRNVYGVEIVEIDGPVAFSVPGRRGGVIIGSELFGYLDVKERAAVLAHENAHLRFHHHRYVWFAEICAAGFPFLIPLARSVRFLTERWADEVAAEHVGSREVVAATIARVALMPKVRFEPSVLGLGGANVVARCQALVSPRSQSMKLGVAATFLVFLLAAPSSGLQFHHMAAFFSHVCGN